MHNNEIVFFINGIRGHAFMEDPTYIKFNTFWYKLIAMDTPKFDKFDDTYDSISVANYNHKTSTLDRFTVAYDDSGLKAVLYNDKYYVAQADDGAETD